MVRFLGAAGFAAEDDCVDDAAGVRQCSLVASGVFGFVDEGIANLSDYDVLMSQGSELLIHCLEVDCKAQGIRMLPEMSLTLNP